MAYVAPSVRLPVLYSPYSTASASKAKSNDMDRFWKRPKTKNVTTTVGRLAGMKKIQVPTTMRPAAPTKKVFFLPTRATNLGTTGTATKVASDVASTIQISWLELPRMYAAK